METNNLATRDNKRDGTIDTIKGILIFLVVFGHLIRGKTSSSMNIYGITHYLIYSVHMPLFILISGIMSKKPTTFVKILKNLLIPYIIANIIAHIIHLAIGTFQPKDLIIPYEVTWYILSLAVFRLIDKGGERISVIACIVTVILSIATSQIDQTVWRILSFGRILLLYPLFFIGKYINPDKFYQLKRKKWIGFTTLAFSVCALLVLLFSGVSPVTWATHDYPGSVMTVLLKYLYFAISFCILASLLIILPSQGSFVERWGRNSMTVYLIHIFICVLVHYIYPVFPIWLFPIAVIFSIVLVDFLSREFVVEKYRFLIYKICLIFKIE